MLVVKHNYSCHCDSHCCHCYCECMLQDETPLQFHMLGIDLYMNSHFDDWIVDISAWQPGPIDDENWRVPDMCHQAEVQELQRHHLDSSLVMEVAKQLPNPHFGESACP